MKINGYLKDKFLYILIYLFSILFIFLLLKLFKLNDLVNIIIVFVLLLNSLVIILLDYFKKRVYYNRLIDNLNRLDKKYLVLETIEEPNTYEEKLINSILYDINKSMIENIKINENNITEFKEFVEMWIHEVKIPISSLVLKCHNNKEKYSKDLLSTVRKLDNYVDQVLYYVRSENTEKDFSISEVNLKDIIRNVSLKNKDDLLENNILLEVENINSIVYTDKKWMEFIITQIINNSIKYKKDSNCLIKISSEIIDNNVLLKIYDNGIGIPKKDIKNVFNKSFTGSNGREKVKSTGMGLYIVKNLCNKLGHNITIDSVEKEYTEVTIIFGINDLYKM